MKTKLKTSLLGRSHLFGAVICVTGLIWIASRTQAQNLVTNGSFEYPVVTTFSYGPTNAVWTFPSLGGISHNQHIAPYAGFLTAGSIPDGVQLAYIQELGNYMDQQITFPNTGTYLLDYFAGGRKIDASGGPPFGGDTSYQVYIISDGVTNVIATGNTSTDTAMTKRGPVRFIASAGPATLRFQVTQINIGNPDQTALFDEISITPAPQLAINLSTINAILTWSTNFSGYLLQTNGSLTTTNWATLTTNYSVISTNYAITNFIGSDQLYFRLSQ